MTVAFGIGKIALLWLPTLIVAGILILHGRRILKLIGTSVESLTERISDSMEIRRRTREERFENVLAAIKGRIADRYVKTQAVEASLPEQTRARGAVIAAETEAGKARAARYAKRPFISEIIFGLLAFVGELIKVAVVAAVVFAVVIWLPVRFDAINTRSHTTTVVICRAYISKTAGLGDSTQAIIVTSAGRFTLDNGIYNGVGNTNPARHLPQLPRGRYHITWHGVWAPSGDRWVTVAALKEAAQCR